MPQPPRRLTEEELYKEVLKSHDNEKKQDRVPEKQEIADVLLVGSTARAKEFREFKSDIDLIIAVNGVCETNVSDAASVTASECKYREISRASGLRITESEGVIDVITYHISSLGQKIEDDLAYSLRERRYKRYSP